MRLLLLLSAWLSIAALACAARGANERTLRSAPAQSAPMRVVWNDHGVNRVVVELHSDGTLGRDHEPLPGRVRDSHLETDDGQRVSMGPMRCTPDGFQFEGYQFVRVDEGGWLLPDRAVRIEGWTERTYETGCLLVDLAMALHLTDLIQALTQVR